MGGICVNFIDSDLFLRFLKRRCYGNQFLTNLANWPLFNMLAFRNGFDYRNSDLKLFSGNIFLHTVLCKFDQYWSSNP